MPDDAIRTAEILRLRRERDLYLRLLRLSEQNDLQPFLDDALALIVEVTGAARALLELYDADDGNGGRRWSNVHGLSEGQVESVRAAISKGIIASALATGTTVVNPALVGEATIAASDVEGRLQTTDLAHQGAGRSIPRDDVTATVDGNGVLAVKIRPRLAGERDPGLYRGVVFAETAGTPRVVADIVVEL